MPHKTNVNTFYNRDVDRVWKLRMCLVRQFQVKKTFRTRILLLRTLYVRLHSFPHIHFASQLYLFVCLLELNNSYILLVVLGSMSSERDHKEISQQSDMGNGIVFIMDSFCIVWCVFMSYFLPHIICIFYRYWRKYHPNKMLCCSIYLSDSPSSSLSAQYVFCRKKGLLRRRGLAIFPSLA